MKKLLKKSKKVICSYCDKNFLEKGDFRCGECANSSVFDSRKRSQPAAQIRWKQPNGEYSRRPYQ